MVFAMDMVPLLGKIHSTWSEKVQDNFELKRISIKFNTTMTVRSSFLTRIVCNGIIRIFVTYFIMFLRLHVNPRPYFLQSMYFQNWHGIDLNLLVNMKLEWAIHELMCSEYEYIAQYSSPNEKITKKWNWMNWALRWKLCWKFSSISSRSC